MNLAEIRKKAGAVKKDESASGQLANAHAPTVSPDILEHRESPALADFFSEPPAAVDTTIEEILTEEVFSEEPAEVAVFAEDELMVNSEPVLQQVPVNSGATVIQPDRTEDRIFTGSPVKNSNASPLEVIVAGREASADAEDLLTIHGRDSSTDIEEYLCFRVADEEYAISIMSIKEIIKPREVTEVPRVPLFIQGVISLRGLIIPVMDMRCRLSLPVGGGTGRERIVVVRKDAGFCGILVDEVVQVARVAKKDIEEPPAVLDGIDKAFVKGLGHYDGRMIILLDLDAILDAGIH